MAHKDKFGATELTKGKIDHLSISWDYDDDQNDKSQRKPVFLFVPHMDEPEHHHIELDNKQAKKLRDWLINYLKDVK